MLEIRIRAAELADLNDIYAIFTFPSVIAATTELPYRSHAQVQERVMPKSPDEHLLVAEVEGRVVGTVSLEVRRNPRRRHVASLGIAVHDHFRRQAIGTALMSAALDLADRWLNLHRVELQVFTDNVPAIRLYERFGFTIEGTLRDCALRDGKYADAYLMARLRR